LQPTWTPFASLSIGIEKSVRLADLSGVATFFLALFFIPAAIAFFSILDDLVTAVCLLPFYWGYIEKTNMRFTDAENLGRAVHVPEKQFFFLPSSIASKTADMLPTLQLENFELLGRSPLVAEANMM
jgi:hypothetical protein